MLVAIASTYALRSKSEVNWVAVKELNLSYYIWEDMLDSLSVCMYIYTYTHCGKLF